MVSLRSLNLWRMPAMVAPRALVFRPLVKGNEGFENEIGQNSVFQLKWLLPESLVLRPPIKGNEESRNEIAKNPNNRASVLYLIYLLSSLREYSWYDTRSLGAFECLHLHCFFLNLVDAFVVEYHCSEIVA